MGCSWEREFKPVDGWKARKKTYRPFGDTRNTQVETWEVIDCPLFIPPSGKYKKPKSFAKKQAKKNVNMKKKPIHGLCIKTGEVRTWGSVYETFPDGFTPTKVSECINGKRRSHKGWRFWFVRASTVEKENRNDAKGENE